MNRKTWYIFLILFIQTYSDDLVGQEYYNIPLSSAKYFDNHTSFSAALDSSDYLWVGTNKGLYRFDGGQAINATDLLSNWQGLANSFIYEIQCDQHNRLWLNTKTQGIAIVDLDRMQCVRIPILNKEGVEIFDYGIQSLVLDNDYAWASLWNSNEVEGGLLQVSLTNQSINVTALQDIIVPGMIHMDRQNDNHIWITGESLIKFDKASKKYREIEYESTINAEHLISITENFKGDLYISFRDAKDNNRTNRILRFDKHSDFFSEFIFGNNLQSSINYINMYNDSLLLMTTSKEPYFQMYNTHTESIVEWKLKDDLLRSSGRVVRLKSGGIAITGNNLNYLNKIEKVYASKVLGSESQDFDAYYGNGHMIDEGYLFPQLGSRGYLNLLDTNSMEISRLQLDQEYNYRAVYDIGKHRSLAVARDAIVIVDRNEGVVNTLKHISDYLPDETATRLFFNSSSDPNGNVWIATSHNSVLKYDIVKARLEDYKMPTWDKANPSFIFDIAADEQGNIFAAGRYEVFYKAKVDSLFVSLEEKFTNLDLPSNLIPYSISTIKDGEFLLGTWAKGTYRININTGEVRRVGPEINNVYIESIRSLRDNKYALIAGDYLAFYDSENDHYKILKEKHGIDVLPLRNPFTFSNKSMEAISFNGALRWFDVDNLLEGKDQKINISRIAINGVSHTIDNYFNLKHDQNNIEIDYALSENDIYNQVKYRYSLSADDPKWIDVNSKKNLMFTDLEPDNYTFSIQSTSIDGFWINNHKEVTIKINPPWYLTWWAKLIFALALLSILFAIIRVYINYQKRNLEYDKRFAQLETMILKSQMNPHFIFNSLNSIRYLFMKDQKDKGLKYITKFAKLLRSTLHHGEEALVTLSEEIELTELYIELEQLRFEGKFEFISIYEETNNWKDILVPPFVVQPLVENAFWHGLSHSDRADKRIIIKIEKQNSEWLIHVEDNGVGINSNGPSADMEVGKKKSYGLSILKERFELINRIQKNRYSLTVDSRANQKGTIATIKIIETS